MAKIGYRLKSNANKAVSIYVNFRSPNSDMLENKTGLSVKPTDWSKQKQRTKARDPHLQQINNTLNNLSAFIDVHINTSATNGTLIDKKWLIKTINSFFNRVEQKDPMYLINFFEEFIKRAVKEHEAGIGVKKSTIKGHKSFFNILSSYESEIETSIRFDQIDKVFIDDFYGWLLLERQYKSGNANRHLDRLKTLCKEAASSGVKVNPAYSFYKAKKDLDKKYLIIISESEFQKIKSFTPKSDRDINTKKWMLIGLCIGQRVSDLLKLTKSSIRKSKDGNVYIDITQQKGEKSITVPIKDSEVIDIIYNDFPHKISSQKFNEYMKEICKDCGINQETTGYLKNENNRLELKTGPKWMFISSHDFRRSFATNFFYKGVPVPVLMNITGHKRESTFFEYIGHKFTKDEQAETFLKYL